MTETAFGVDHCLIGYSLRKCPEKGGMPAVRVNPRRARAFANSRGRLAGTGKVDAEAPRETGQRLGLPECPPESEEMLRLQALQLRRRQLAEDEKRENARLKQTADPQMRCSIQRVLAVMEEETAGLSEQIEACITASHDWSERALAAVRLGSVRL